MSSNDNPFKQFKRPRKVSATYSLLGAAAAIALLLPTTPANAAMLKLGTVDVQIDTTVSVGVSQRVEDRETELLPSVNGGPTDTRAVTNGATASAAGTEGSPAAVCLTNGSICYATGNTAANANYDSSINTDDGRLNFDNGDLTNGTLKFSSDIEAAMGNFTGFARVTGFYDAVLDSDSSYERGGMTDKGESADVMHIDLLDAYVDFETEVFGNPLLVRAGKQVINWGESTFVLGGNSVFSPIDVGAILRPGAEIKEALLPVEALYASISLPYDLSVEAYYGGHDEFKLPSSGTAFGNTDSFVKGASVQGEGFFIGGSAFSGAGRINCDTLGAGATTQALSTAFRSIIEDYNGVTCDDNPQFAFNYSLANRDKPAEQLRREYEDPYFMTRRTDMDPDADDDSYGLAVRWYAENLNSTEFGFYYQSYRSRIPYASVITTGPELGYSTVAPTASQTTRTVNATGCAGLLGGYAASSITGSAAILTAGSALDGNAIKVRDRLGILDSGSDLTTINSVLAGGVGTFDIRADSDGDITLAVAQAAACQSVIQQNNSPVIIQADDVNYTHAADAGGLGAGLQGAVRGYGWGDGTPMATGDAAHSGEMYIAVGFPQHLVAEYPEEIEVFGLSAATTLLGWGIQGELAYRPDMPLSRDSDGTVIAGLVSGCAFTNYGALQGTFEALSEHAVADGVACTDEETLIRGYTKEYDVLNWDIGTTATFTRSNPVVSFLGADLGILLTELAGVTVPDAEDPTIGRAADGSALASKCTSGSDLALRGVFGLDPRGEDECRPTRSAWGYVLFGQLQFNNVFGTPFALKPTLAYQAGAEGRAVAPAASWVEDQSRLGLSVGFEYQSKWQGSLGYTMYDGDVLYNRNIDRDNISLSVSYAF